MSARHPQLMRWGVLIGAMLLLAALVPLSQPYRHAAAWRVAPRHQIVVDKALAGAAAAFETSPQDYKRLTRPSVEELKSTICVTLADYRRDGSGSFQGCYDRRNGTLASQRAVVCAFGGRGLVGRLWEAVAPWVW
jgi:hypothetical protein